MGIWQRIIVHRHLTVPRLTELQSGQFARVTDGTYAAAVVGGAQKEVCTRTTSHHWIQLRFSKYETWRCLGVILSSAWRCCVRSSFTLNEGPHLFTSVTFAWCCNEGVVFVRAHPQVCMFLLTARFPAATLDTQDLSVNDRVSR